MNCLKSLCEQQLTFTLTTGSVVANLLFADENRLHHLKLKSIEFLAEHLTEVKETQSWKTLMPTRFDLLQELLLHTATLKK